MIRDWGSEGKSAHQSFQARERLQVRTFSKDTGKDNSK